MKYQALIFLIVLSLITLTPWGTAKARDDNSEALRFGIIMNDLSENVPDQMNPLLKDLETAIGKPVELVVFGSKFRSDYSGVVRGLQTQEIDVGLLAPNTMARAVEQGFADGFASIVNYDDTADFSSVLFVHKDSDIKSIDDIFSTPQKYSFTYGRKTSNFGYLLPNFFFKYYGLIPEQHFISVGYNDFRNNVKHIMDKTIDVGVSNTTFLCRDVASAEPPKCRLRDERPDILENIRVIWMSPSIKQNTLAFRNNLNARLKEKIRDFFYSYGETEEQKEVLKNIDFYKIEKFEEMKNSDLDYLLDIRPVVYGGVFLPEEQKMYFEKVKAYQETQKFFTVDEKGNMIIDEKGLDDRRAP